jgi:hypothetical protein
MPGEMTTIVCERNWDGTGAPERKTPVAYPRRGSRPHTASHLSESCPQNIRPSCKALRWIKVPFRCRARDPLDVGVLRSLPQVASST